MKKILLCILSMALTMQLVGGVFQIKKVYALEEEIFGEEVEFYVEETLFKTIYKAVMENGDEYISEYDKISSKAYMNNHEIEYSFGEGTPVNNQNNIIETKNSPYASTNP